MVGHVIADIDDRFSFFGEVSLTARNSGYSIEVERAFLRYDFSDAFKVGAGRYHTPVGYWNTGFHHGSWLQTSVARPEMIKFGGRFIPTHFVGLMAEGSFPATGIGFGYTAGVGNGRSTNVARAGDAGDINDRPAWVASVRSRPLAVSGLEIGASVYSDRLAAADSTPANETIYAVHAILDRDSPEIMAEYAHVQHTDAMGSGQSSGSDAYYVQVAYRLSGVLRAFKPYVRFESLDVPEDAFVFGPMDLGYDGAIFGVRWDVADFVALKAEYRLEEFEDSEQLHSFYAQASFVLTGS
jgi:hypothetical protein